MIAKVSLYRSLNRRRPGSLRDKSAGDPLSEKIGSPEKSLILKFRSIPRDKRKVKFGVPEIAELSNAYN